MTDGAALRVAWVTGAGKGIGRALAKRLAEDGWTVAASARTQEDLASLEAECPSEAVRGFPLDVTDAVATGTVIERIESQLGGLDLAVFAGTQCALWPDPGARCAQLLTGDA